jgi:hypothetical protein
VVDIPFEFVGEVASTGAVAEAGHVESLTSARHGGWSRRKVQIEKVEEERKGLVNGRMGER